MKNLIRYTTLLGAALSILAAGSSIAAIQTGANQIDRNGFYVGLSANLVNHSPPLDASEDADVIGIVYIAPGATIGYQFNKYIAVQSDFNYFEWSNNNDYSENGVHVNTPDHYYFYSGDLLAKAMLPLGKHFSLNGYGGVAIVHENTYNVRSEGEAPVVNTNRTNLSPVVGAGVEYYFPEYVSIGTSIMYIPASTGIYSTYYMPIYLNVRF